MVNKDKNKVWKFFKPSIIKVIIAAIILFVFIPVVSIDSGVRCVTEPCDSESTVSLLIYIVSIFEGEVTVYGFFKTNLVLGIIASYLLSCIVVVIVAYLKDKAKDI